MNNNYIKHMCEHFAITHWSINEETGLLDVDNDVSLYNMLSTNKLPFRFGKVTGNFNCGWNRLISLEGCPKYVGGFVDCCGNKLTELDYVPEYVGKAFDCRLNSFAKRQTISVFNSCVLYAYDLWKF